MFFPIFLIWILVHLSQCLGIQDSEVKDIVIDQNVTGVLGEEVYLRCLYTGNYSTISSWYRKESGRNAKKKAGYGYNGKAFNFENFSPPASPLNLTVRVAIDSLDVEGEYICGFQTDIDESRETMRLMVIARPAVSTHVEENVVNGTHYQTVFCSASNAKPMALISWKIRGAPPSEIFTITTINVTHPNKTASIISTLRYPILLNNESSVSCVVQHPALTQPNVTDVMLQTFVSPNITMEKTFTQKEGKDFIEVVCSAAGGRPHPDITWILPGPADAQYSQKNETGFSSTSRFPPHLYEGENVTCIFGYALLPATERRTVTLPTYNLTSLQLNNHSSEMNNESASDVLVLKEGESDIIISLAVVGDTPSYTLNCTKDGVALSEDVEVVNSSLLFKQPVSLNLSGQYECQASYYRHTASVKFGIKVNPTLQEPVTFPPNISVNVWKKDGSLHVECLASNAVPPANVSWDFPAEVNGRIQSNLTSSNGSHTVRSIVTLPACWSRELTIECVVEHLDLKDQERQKAVLPACVASNITLSSNTTWGRDVAYMEVSCNAEVVTLAATFTWHTEECRHGINASGNWSEVQNNNSVRLWSTVHLPVPSYAGCTVVCVLKDQDVDRPERKSISIPSIGVLTINVVASPQKDFTLWAAVCKYEGNGVIPKISWVISDHNTTTEAMSVHTFDGIKVLVNSTYQFPLRLHEGKNLSCVVRNDFGEDDRRTVRIPKYFISSIAVMNKTIPLKNHEKPRVHRVALQEKLPHQRIVFRVNGNTPAHNITCSREDGSSAHITASALVFAKPASPSDAGLYECQASWYHHKANILLQVDVEDHQILNITFILICFSTAVAITLFLTVILCVFCKRSSKIGSSDKDRRKRESLAALMQDPRSPDLRAAALAGAKSQEYAELVRYSIVLDVKSTV